MRAVKRYGVPYLHQGLIKFWFYSFENIDSTSCNILSSWLLLLVLSPLPSRLASPVCSTIMSTLMSTSFLILSLVRTRFRYHDISSCCYDFVILNAIKLFSANYERQWCGDVSLVNFPDKDPDSLDYLVTGEDAYLEDDVFVYKHTGDLDRKSVV